MISTSVFRKSMKIETLPSYQVYMSSSTTVEKCRTCLAIGIIPIYGENISLELEESIRSIAGISIHSQDDFPKYICESCYKKLQTALQFRKLAQESQSILENSSKQGYINELNIFPLESNNDQHEIIDEQIKQEEPDSDASMVPYPYDNLSEPVCLCEPSSKACLYGQGSEQLDDKVLKDCKKKKKRKINLPLSPQDSKLDLFQNKKRKIKIVVDRSEPDFNFDIVKKKSSSLVQFYKVISDDLNETDAKKIKVQCLKCSKIIIKRYFRQHHKLHDESEPKHVCETCGSSFRSKSAFIYHKNSHDNDFRFKCTICPYKTHNKEHLNKHTRTHTGDYRYICTECPAKFITKSNLNIHVRRNHREPQFKCDICPKNYHTRPDLTHHVKTVHMGIREHVCTDCGEEFSCGKNLNRHQLKFHKKKKICKGRPPTYLLVEQREAAHIDDNNKN